jgi:DNA-binding transcriptional ArsR family regulator
MDTANLQPTLWRTCRVLANRKRLEILRLLLRQPGQTVSSVAQRIRLPISSTSEQLRALEARGLLVAQRTGRWVKYAPSSAAHPSFSTSLVAVMQPLFLLDKQALDHIYGMVTAFTHPSRILIFRTLRLQPHDLLQLQTASHISRRALLRHLHKLEARGFITKHGAFFLAEKRTDPIGRELARLAVLQNG